MFMRALLDVVHTPNNVHGIQFSPRGKCRGLRRLAARQRNLL